MNADGSGLRNVTRTPSDDLDPAWSPDGRAIAFVQKKCVPSPRPAVAAYETYLYVVNADGSGLRRLTTRRAHLFNPSWSADGKTIRYGRSLVNADGSGHSELPRNVPLAGAWSPDGQRIAVVSVAHSPAEARNPTKLGLWVMNADGSNARRVAPTPPRAIPRGPRTAAGSPSGGSTASSGRRELRPLCRERRRERAATADTPGGEPALVRVVTRRADDRLPPQQRGVHRESRRKRGTEAHAAQRIVEGQAT